MPPKIQCPLSRDEFAALYEQMHAEALAIHINERFGMSISKGWVIARLKEFGIPRRIYSPYTATQIECPFTRDRLYELYWHDGLPTQAIAEKASAILGRSICKGTVGRWLRRANIKLRTPREWLAVRTKSDPERWTAHAHKYLRGGYRAAGLANITNPAIQKRGAKAAAEKKRRECWETRQCARCGRSVERRRSAFRHSPELTYCSNHCANSDRSRQRAMREAAQIASEIAKGEGHV